MQKQKTRQKIILAAKQEFIKKGFLNTSTAQIAARVGIAHGTLFLHFKNKNSLILEVLDSELSEINESIHKVILASGDLREMLAAYLHELQEAEDLFSVIARELPFYPGALRRMILFRESIIRSYFYSAIEKDIVLHNYRPINISSAITFLFGTISYYLSLKKIFVQSGSVIGKFKEDIIETFLHLIHNKEE